MGELTANWKLRSSDGNLRQKNFDTVRREVELAGSPSLSDEDLISPYIIII